MDKNVILDDRLDSYVSFFDHRWSKKIHRLAKGTALEDVVFNLCTAWKGAANTHVMPWLMVQQLRQFHDGVLQEVAPYGMLLINKLLRRLNQEAAGLIPFAALERFRQIVGETSRELEVNRRRIKVEFDTQDVWKKYFDNPEFRLSIWASQRLVYGAVYFAYEDFLVSLYEQKSGKTGYWIRKEQFEKDFTSEFNAELCRECWTHHDVNIARLTRHALVHNGGRLTSHLKKERHGLELEGEEIQIMPVRTKSLFDLLKVRTLRLTEYFLKPRGPQG